MSPAGVSTVAHDNTVVATVNIIIQKFSAVGCLWSSAFQSALCAQLLVLIRLRPYGVKGNDAKAQ